MDHDERNHILFKNIFSEHKISIKLRIFFTTEEMMNYLNHKNAIIPEILFMNYECSEKSALHCIDVFRSCNRFSHMTTAVYSDELSPAQEEEFFIKGTNVMMKMPDNYIDLKNSLTEIITINWQYHTSGLNKDNFIMKV
ncbi:response regulator [Chryseobacterium sp. SSA4.19]|uniref:response regulator n=1 Tax=Chryseobacterium sp. SSA4.19 TaxID=2919915 RepID=UPI001F4FAA4E|nr:response regulator [Chryseobacterium sp. SSA4.19]MCJ8153722.1 response regulator [Chryseobacterium sp. SSA4.19]